jgi:ABC-2 type transport system permease protein
VKGVMLQVATLWSREIVRFVRQRSRVTGALLQPLVFWLLLGAGLGASFRPAGMPEEVGYAQYFYPGITVLVLLFSAIFSTISTVEDRKAGFLQGVLVAPIARRTIVLGQALGGATLALGQGAIFLALAPAAGIAVSAGALAATIGLLAVVAFALTNIGLAIAWRIGSTQGFHALMNLILIPMWLLSGAVFPAAGAPAWLEWTMRLNPLTYAMAAIRQTLYLGEPELAGPGPALAASVAITLAFAAFAYLLAMRTAERARIA